MRYVRVLFSVTVIGLLVSILVLQALTYVQTRDSGKGVAAELTSLHRRVEGLKQTVERHHEDHKTALDQSLKDVASMQTSAFNNLFAKQ